MSKKHIPFGIMLHGPGSHMNAWKHPSVPADASVNLPFYIDIVQRAEANGIAFGFVADSLYLNEAFIPHFLNRFEPISILSALAAVTKKIGLVGTVSTFNSDPEADIKCRRIRTLPSTEEALAHLGRFFDHHDFSQYRLDAPFPELGDVGDNGPHSMTARIKADARNNRLTLREVARNVATPTSNFVGSGKRVANELIRWVDEGAADGFILGFPVQAEGLDDFLTHVVPVLHSRALSACFDRSNLA
jgi:alkanesulfonate monooxygenase SsuD/methylene tetrahydromethanopterin reductase-like flavin-dependent oxidoreductase (luciferase family)